MNNITLHKIFRHLTNDENFLSTVIETKHKETTDGKKKKKKQTKCNLMANMVAGYGPLSPYEKQNYIEFPPKFKVFLSPDYVRLGIKNIMEKDLNNVNVSFLNSLNILLRPDIYNLSMDEHTKNLLLLEEYICHVIRRNFRIDRIKKTKKGQIINNELIKNLTEGKISHELIQTIINIFEINLLVFDLTKMDIYLYWTKGNKYPYFNLFKNIYCMSYVQGNYEPLMPPDNTINIEQKQKMYTLILTNIKEIKCVPEVQLAAIAVIYIDTWNIDKISFSKILETFYGKKESAAELLQNLIKMEEKQQ